MYFGDAIKELKVEKKRKFINYLSFWKPSIKIVHHHSSNESFSKTSWK